MTEDTRFLVRVVKKASRLIAGKMNVKDKDERGDLVTNFDLAIEKFIVGKLKKKYPDFDIVSEEFNSQKKLSKNCFTIDPIDGTINFANGIPLWGIQVACVRDGQTCAAVIYLPRLKEFYWADKEGAFLNGKRIEVKPKPLKNSIIILPPIKKIENYRDLLEKVPHFREFWTGSVQFAWMAAGKIDGWLFYGGTKPWDIVPGMFLIKQADAFVYQKDGLYIAASSKELFDLLKNCKRS